MRTAKRDRGSKASMAFMMPPKAETHIIITMTHSPAPEKPP